MKLLFIANYFPPVNTSASIRALNYVNYLSELGNDVYVVTIDYPKDYINYDTSLNELIHKDINLVKVDSGFIYRKIYPRKKIDAKNNSVKKKSKLSFIKKFIKKMIVIPDSYLEWRKNAEKIALKLIKKESITHVISMHESPSTLLIGLKLKKKIPDINWISYWSDPWTYDSNRKDQSSIRKLIEKQMEKEVVKFSDKFFFTTNETRKLYIEKYKLDRSKTYIVYRGYEDEKTSNDINLEYIKKGKVNIIHLGELYTKLRDIKPLIAALKKLQKEKPLVYQKINVLLIGGIDDTHILEEAKKISCITISPRVSYEKAKRYMNMADLLLVWGNKASTQIPGKIYEYFGTVKPIVSLIADKNDPLYSLMKKYNKGPIVFNNQDDIYTLFTELIEYEKVENQWYEKVEEFKWENVVKDLYKKIID